MERISLQDRYAPNSVCFGCGPKNPRGLRVKSFPDGDSVVAEWRPEPHHLAFSNFASGGILSVLMDCHGNWTAAYTLMREKGNGVLPATVTAEYTMKFLCPTPMDSPWRFVTRAVKTEGSRVLVEGRVEAGGHNTATMSGVFVAVKEGHPAYHRWE